MKNLTAFGLVLLASLFCIISCDKNPVIDDETMLDGDILFDASLYDPAAFLVSAADPEPTASQLAKPVVIAVHGYTATTFEWSELRSWAEQGQEDILISQVLLGGHGRDYESFKASTWEDWRDPILEEYTRLEALGYTNISLAGSSTGCPLIMELFSSDAFAGHQAPNEVFLVDPMLIPGNKLLSIIKVVGPMLGYTETETTDATAPYWYRFRPQETLQELMELSNHIRIQLESGISLPEGTRLKVYKSLRDAAADAIGALMLYKGIDQSNGEKIDVEMVDSDLHVYTRLAGRSDDEMSPGDQEKQIAAFTDFVARMEE